MLGMPLLADFVAYNTRIVLLGTLLLGMCSGVVGAFMLLRKKALVGDVASHAALPGIGIAYLTAEAITPGSGKSLPWLLLGASLSAGCGVVLANLIQRLRLIKEDAALGIVLSLFFGLGIVLLTVIQGLKTGTAAGLNDFVFGKTAAITLSDVVLIAIASLIALVMCAVLFKEFTILCFDQEYAAALGWPVKQLDLLLTVLVVGVTVIGMQSVGLLLVVALLIIPATAARFWTDRLGPMALISSAIGGLSSSLGVLLSAQFERLAAGPTIVLMGAVMFVFSLLCGTKRGTLEQYWRHQQAVRKKGQLDLLRSCYEDVERRLAPEELLRLQRGKDLPDLTPYPITFAALTLARTWSKGRLSHLLHAAIMEGSLRTDSDGAYRLTHSGTRLAAQAVRDHRLWELYLIHFADVDLNRVDRDADLIEHVLEPGIIEQLESLLQQDQSRAIPTNPHG